MSWSSIILHKCLESPSASSWSLGLLQSCWSQFSFTGFIWLCRGRLISKEFGTKRRPSSIPAYNLGCHLVLCPLVRWWWGSWVREAQMQLFHCRLYPVCWMNRTELRAPRTEIALLKLLPLLPHTTSPPQKRRCIKRGGGSRRNPPRVHARRMRQFQLPWICRLILTALLWRWGQKGTRFSSCLSLPTQLPQPKNAQIVW